METLNRLASQIDLAMARDRHRLRGRLRSIQQARRHGKPFDRNLERLQAELNRSQALLRRRQEAVPQVRYDPDLPITVKVDEIREAVESHPVTIVCGETGSGKSTQLPKICLAIGRGIDGVIGHTQPRRIAARSIASRLSEELGSPLGRHVGFKVRFTDTTRDETYIKLMTDGILLAETQQDRFLDQYDTLIIDEAHERSLNIDFLLGYVQGLLTRRRDLKLIITSATIDAARFAEHFRDSRTGQPAPVIEVSGRTYPVDIRYHPIETNVEEDHEEDPQDAILQAVDELARIDRGDILVFLPTERDIRETAKALRRLTVIGGQQRTEILPLYARLSPADQNRVFQPHKQRRIVLATNVAESSLTVPGIRFVIDTGTARISRYSPRRKVQRLPIELVSQASAEQRAGRCGRIGPGVCIRLYGEEDYLTRERYTTPEIRRTNLASVILRTKALRLGDIEAFPFLDPPRADAIRDGYSTLFELGAIDERQQLTETGSQLARLPVDPRIGRMVLAAAEEGCLRDVLIIAAALEVQDPRERPVDRREAADACHAQFADKTSDFFSYLKLWDFYHSLREKLSRNRLKKACRQNFLSQNRMREWLDVHRQLKQLVGEAGLKRSDRTVEGEMPPERRYAAIHRVLLAGLLSNVAYRTDTYEYTGGDGKKVYLWPGSGCFDVRPMWIVAAEMVETTKNYARTVAKINPDWIEPLAGHLVKRDHRDPYWSRRHGSAMVFERVTLYGLPIVQRRRVPLGPIDPVNARELLIREGLIQGELRARLPFVEQNRALVAELEQEATKLRRFDLFVGKAEQFDFYHERLPARVHDFSRLKQWLKRSGRDQLQRLFMTREDLLSDPPAESEDEAFPEGLAIGPTQLPLQYRFEPGNEDDGITLTVPRVALGQLDSGRLGWLVPGLLEQKIVALIRSLPKSIRRNFVPAPDVARRAVERLRFGEQSFLKAVATALGELCNEPLSPNAFQLDRLPPHLRMNVRVVDDQGQTMARGRDVEQLQLELGIERQSPFDVWTNSEWHRDGIDRWDFGTLPEDVAVDSGGITIVAYPMLIDRGADVGLRLAETPEVAERQTRTGLRRLCCLAERKELRAQIAWMPGLDRIKLVATTQGGWRKFEEQLMDRVVDLAFLDQPAIPRTETEFQELLQRGKKRIGLAVQDVTHLVPALMEACHQALLTLENVPPGIWEDAVNDMREQLDRLTADGFLVDTPWGWLQHYPRYLRAIPRRLEKLRNAGLHRDQQNLRIVARFQQDYDERATALREANVYDDQLVQFRWMLEELRVSLFAQDLGTSLTISPQRLQRQWEKVRHV